MKKLNNQKGFSLAELMAGIPLVIIIGFIVSVALLHFVKEYNEIELYTRLQRELAEAIEIMRYGYAKEGVTDDKALLGLLTAGSVSLNQNRSSVNINSSMIEDDENFSRFFVDEEGQLKVSGRYDTQTFSNEMLFPSSNTRIGNELQFQIIDHSVFYPAETIDNEIVLLGIKLKARVRYREKSEDQSVEEDLKLNTKTITYKTKVFIGNTE